MLQSKDSTQYFSFVIIPPSGRKSYTFRINKTIFKSLVSLFILSIITISVLFYIGYDNNHTKSEFKHLKIETQKQNEKIQKLDSTLDDLQNHLQNIIEREEELRLLLGDAEIKKKRTRKRKRKSKRPAKAFAKKYKKINTKQISKEELVKEKLDFLKKEILNSKSNYTLLLDKAHQYKSRFASTPSIRPLYGRVLSKYGWRKHPISKRRKFHKGIDIASWIGAPIQSGADGIIEYAGWSGTFGYVVVIDHNFGYRSIYAHCSQLLVKRKQLVKKGQIIAQVGTTGLSTGPHLHYEIRKWRQSINPLPYLNLDMFTASSRIW
jgi:murein DD-endopeptidase MepM/ murein hydrolase activator NlpD